MRILVKRSLLWLAASGFALNFELAGRRQSRQDGLYLASLANEKQSFAEIADDEEE